jgi:hypothetical protein
MSFQAVTDQPMQGASAAQQFRRSADRDIFDGRLHFRHGRDSVNCRLS